MLGDISGVREIYIVTGYTDMRKSIDGLCAIIEEQFSMSVTSTCLYLLCGKKCDRIKALIREPDLSLIEEEQEESQTVAFTVRRGCSADQDRYAGLPVERKYLDVPEEEHSVRSAILLWKKSVKPLCAEN